MSSMEMAEAVSSVAMRTEMDVSNASASTDCTFSGTVTEPLRLSTDTSTLAALPSSREDGSRSWTCSPCAAMSS